NTTELAKEYDLGTETGVVVTGIVRSGAADRAGIAPGDVLQSLDDEPLSGAKDLRRRIDRIRPGESATIGIVRKGDARQMRVTIGDYVRYLEEIR
ncbi:MAG: PDZ domain-containing protein, partial [Planctomycetes bacterium]|nr:PDZ domain-containing protein [Planctomycetota bacterium]